MILIIYSSGGSRMVRAVGLDERSDQSDTGSSLRQRNIIETNLRLADKTLWGEKAVIVLILTTHHNY